ncbi:MAG: hypothetical protein NZ528_00835 [Caldilineales bacterium]|nr:hypothetical protein [Caldilineales bacterium]
MAASEERLRILQMVEQGRLTAEEGLRLLEALAAGRRERREDTTAEASASPRWLRVRVTDLRTGKQKVNVNIPLRLVNVGVKMGARFAPELAEMDVLEVARSGVSGKLLDVENVEEGERVEIFVD